MGNSLGQLEACVFNKPNPYYKVDSYWEGPIHRTHKQQEDAKQIVIASQEERRKELDEFCQNFDSDKFIETRDKCDEGLRKEFGGIECLSKGAEKDKDTKQIDFLKKPKYNLGFFTKVSDKTILDVMNWPCRAKVDQGDPVFMKRERFNWDNLEAKVKDKLRDAEDAYKKETDPIQKKTKAEKVDLWRERDLFFHSYYCEERLNGTLPQPVKPIKGHNCDVTVKDRKYIWQHTNVMKLVEGAEGLRRKRSALYQDFVYESTIFKPICAKSEKTKREIETLG